MATYTAGYAYTNEDGYTVDDVEDFSTFEAAANFINERSHRDEQISVDGRILTLVHDKRGNIIGHE